MCKCRLNKLKPTLETFINNFKHIYEVDKHVHLMEMIYEMFIRKWTPYNHLVTWMYWINLSVQVWTWLAYLVFCLKSCMHIHTQMFISCVSMPWWQNIICNTALPNKNMFKIFFKWNFLVIITWWIFRAMTSLYNVTEYIGFLHA